MDELTHVSQEISFEKLGHRPYISPLSSELSLCVVESGGLLGRVRAAFSDLIGKRSFNWVDPLNLIDFTVEAVTDL